MTNRVHMVSMTADQQVGSGGWTEIYSITQASVLLVEFVMKLNTNDMDLRVTLDPGGSEEAVIVDTDLDLLRGELRIDKLEKTVIVSPHSKVFAFKPAQPQWTNNGFKIELRAQNGNKRLEHGYVTWGES